MDIVFDLDERVIIEASDDTLNLMMIPLEAPLRGLAYLALVIVVVCYYPVNTNTYRKYDDEPVNPAHQKMKLSSVTTQKMATPSPRQKPAILSITSTALQTKPRRSKTTAAPAKIKNMSPPKKVGGTIARPPRWLLQER